MKPSRDVIESSCPECEAPLLIPVTFRTASATAAAVEVTADISAAREHVEGHQRADSGEGAS